MFFCGEGEEEVGEFVLALETGSVGGGGFGDLGRRGRRVVADGRRGGGGGAKDGRFAMFETRRTRTPEIREIKVWQKHGKIAIPDDGELVRWTMSGIVGGRRNNNRGNMSVGRTLRSAEEALSQTILLVCRHRVKA